MPSSSVLCTVLEYLKCTLLIQTSEIFKQNHPRIIIINVYVSLKYFTTKYAEQFCTSKDWDSFHAGFANAAEINAWHSTALPAKKEHLIYTFLSQGE